VLARNAFFLLLGQVCSTALAIFLTAALARSLGDRMLGVDSQTVTQRSRAGDVCPDLEDTVFQGPECGGDGWFLWAVVAMITPVSSRNTTVSLFSETGRL
jgi:hypothetical protein